jgi:hypothetical protein
MEDENREYPILVPHSSYGDPDCCGIIMPTRGGVWVRLATDRDTADIELMCNECGFVYGTVPAAEAEAVLLRMAMEEGVCSERCPHCGEMNVILGFSSLEAFTCRFCGQGVKVERPVQ